MLRLEVKFGYGKVWFIFPALFFFREGRSFGLMLGWLFFGVSIYIRREWGK